MVLYRVTTDFKTDGAELQTLTPGCAEPGCWTITCGHTKWCGDAGPQGQGHPCLQKGTVGASGMLNPKGEAFAGLFAFKTTEKCTWAEPPSCVLRAGGCHSVLFRVGRVQGMKGQTASSLRVSNAKKRSKGVAGRSRICPVAGLCPRHEEQQSPLGLPGRVRTRTGNKPSGFRHT